MAQLGFDLATSALNIEIEFDGVSIGALQNVTATESFGSVDVYGIGSPIPDFVPGLYKGSISAKKAFIDMNEVAAFYFTKLQPWGTGTIEEFLPAVRNILLQYSSFIDKTKAEGVASSVNALISNSLLNNVAANSLRYPSDNERVTSVLYFDIKVYTGTVTPTSAAMKTGRELINIYKDCIIESRTLTISNSNIIIMEDLNVKFRQRL